MSDIQTAFTDEDAIVTITVILPKGQDIAIEEFPADAKAKREADVYALAKAVVLEQSPDFFDKDEPETAEGE